MDTWKGKWVRASHIGVTGLHMRCTIMHQNAPNCIKIVSTAWQSFVFWICPEWLILPISGLNGHLKEDRRPSKSWRGHGDAHDVHQNAPKCTKMAWQSNEFWIYPEWLIWSILGLNGHLEGYRSQSKSWRGFGVAHEVHQNAPKCTKMLTITRDSKVFQNCPEWLLLPIFLI